MSLSTLTVVGVVVAAALAWLFFQMRTKDHIEEVMAKRRASSRIVSRADFVEGTERIPVAMALTADKVCYENPDLDACLELQHIEEVEYDDETATGQAVHGRVLRLRSHGHTFEFVFDMPTSRQWEASLAPKHYDQGTAKAS